VASRFLASIELVLDSARRGKYRVALIGGFALPFYGVMRATDDVDFLVEDEGREILHGELSEAGFRCLHRSEDAASYDPPGRELSPLDFIYARRPPSLAMLERAKLQPARGRRMQIPVVDVEGLIGLKAQAIANDPSRRRRDEDDIVRLLERHFESLDMSLLRSYFTIFDQHEEFETLVDEARRTKSKKP
jgi:hypothetical protein